MFLAGADIKEMVDHEFAQTFRGRCLEEWTAVSETSKPVIAAVNDTVWTAKNKHWHDSRGWWNSKVGTSTWKVYGHGCLTGNRVSAQEAKDCGLVSKVLPAEQVVNEAVKLGEKISEQSPLIVQMVKEAERRPCHTTFATNDGKEGMNAFAEKRAPKWTST
ncbi:unnamed protein product [Cylicocyclus nassatus]|uniref:enoyl-CoA hydratase n=1 Tax=Cylicocyclus nassatus TaxID=53992 RepID=A0AA36DTC6_CYLNA|nr:unnamed protein product [Cylicocyclus nassatus]